MNDIDRKQEPHFLSGKLATGGHIHKNDWCGPCDEPAENCYFKLKTYGKKEADTVA